MINPSLEVVIILVCRNSTPQTDMPPDVVMDVSSGEEKADDRNREERWK